MNQIEKQQLSKRDMDLIKGGRVVCGCGCHYAGNGGSGVQDNARANASGGKFSSSCSILLYDNGVWIDASTDCGIW